MIDRFYLPGPWHGSLLDLPDEEFQHLAKVLRKQAGDKVEIFDGQGTRCEAVIEQLTKKQARLALSGEPFFTPAPSISVCLAVAPPKGDRFKWLVEKCTELGIDRLIPLKTSRSIVDPRESKLQKLDQTVIAACKQCRRDRLMKLSPTVDLAELLPHFRDSIAIFGDQFGDRLSEMLISEARPQADILIVVGPEGGFSPDEISFLQHQGARGVAIGGNILRIETAAIALAAACQACV